MQSFNKFSLQRLFRWNHLKVRTIMCDDYLQSLRLSDKHWLNLTLELLNGEIKSFRVTCVLCIPPTPPSPPQKKRKRKEALPQPIIIYKALHRCALSQCKTRTRCSICVQILNRIFSQGNNICAHVWGAPHKRPSKATCL